MLRIRAKPSEISAKSPAQAPGCPLETFSAEMHDVMLDLAPSTNAGDFVTLDINQSVTDAGDSGTMSGQPTFTQRWIQS